MTRAALFALSLALACDGRPATPDAAPLPELPGTAWGTSDTACGFGIEFLADATFVWSVSCGGARPPQVAVSFGPYVERAGQVTLTFKRGTCPVVEPVLVYAFEITGADLTLTNAQGPVTLRRYFPPAVPKPVIHGCRQADGSFLPVEPFDL